MIMSIFKGDIQFKHSSCFLERTKKNTWQLTLRFLLPNILIPRSELAITFADNSKLRFDPREIPVLEEVPQFNIAFALSTNLTTQGKLSKILSTDVTDLRAIFKLPISINPIPGLLHRRILSFSSTVYWLGGVPNRRIEIRISLKGPFMDKPYTSDSTIGFDVKYYRTSPKIPPIGRFLFSSTGERVRPLILSQKKALLEALSTLRSMNFGVWGMADRSECNFWMSKKGAEYVARQLAFQTKIKKTINANYREKRIALVDIDERCNKNERLFWREMTCQSLAGIEIYAQPKELKQKYFAVSGKRIAFEKINSDSNEQMRWALHFEIDKITTITEQYEDLVRSGQDTIIPWKQFISGFSKLWTTMDNSYIKSRVLTFKFLEKRILKE